MLLISRLQHVRGGVQLHPDEVRKPEQAERPEGNLHAPNVRHRHHQHPVRVRRRVGRDYQKQPEGLRSVLGRKRCTSYYETQVHANTCHTLMKEKVVLVISRLEKRRVKCVIERNLKKIM